MLLIIEGADLVGKTVLATAMVRGLSYGWLRQNADRRHKPIVCPTGISYDWRSGQTAAVSHRHVRVHLPRVPRPRPLGCSADAHLYRFLHRSGLHLQQHARSEE